LGLGLGLNFGFFGFLGLGLGLNFGFFGFLGLGLGLGLGGKPKYQTQNHKIFGCQCLVKMYVRQNLAKSGQTLENF
jgi:hypothetical protein